MKKINLLLFCLLLLISIHSQEYKIESIGDWVNVPQWEINPQPSSHAVDGEYFQYYSKQKLIEENSSKSYYAFAIELTNINGVEDNSQVELDFDPTYQDLIIHEIKVLRNGEYIDKLKDATIEVHQKETDSDTLLYDGRLTFNAILKDIRKNDILFYSFTRDGANPVYDGHFTDSQLLEWTVPVHKYYGRIVNRSSKELFIKHFNIDFKPQILTLDGNKEYIWETTYDNSLYWESDIPDWYNPLGRVETTVFKSWLDLKKWEKSLFEQDFDKEVLKNTLKEIITTETTQQQKLSRIIEWVQGDIRYLGIESGANSHKPTTPDITIDRRFGDCKDKSFLLTEMVKLLGLESWPVVISTDRGKVVPESLPLIGLFDHVISAVKIDGKIIFIDPTDSYQFGDLDSFHQPNYYYGMILDDRDKVFTNMDRGNYSSPNIEYKYNFDLSSDVVKFNVTTVNRYSNADYMRYELDSTSIHELQNRYINHYGDYYPNIEEENSLTYKDDKKRNHFETSESYKITDIWEKDEESGTLNVDLYPIDIAYFIQKPNDKIRKMPIKLDYPNYITHKIEAKFDDEQGSFRDDDFFLKSDYIEFDYKSEFKDQTLYCNFSFKVLKSHVAVEDIPEYIDDIEKIRDKLDYSYYEKFKKKPTELITRSNYSRSTRNTVRAIVIVFIAVVAFILKRRKRNNY